MIRTEEIQELTVTLVNEAKNDPDISASVQSACRFIKNLPLQVPCPELSGSDEEGGIYLHWCGGRTGTCAEVWFYDDKPPTLHLVDPSSEQSQLLGHFVENHSNSNLFASLILVTAEGSALCH